MIQVRIPCLCSASGCASLNVQSGYMAEYFYALCLIFSSDRNVFREEVNCIIPDDRVTVLQKDLVCPVIGD